MTRQNNKLMSNTNHQSLSCEAMSNMGHFIAYKAVIEKLIMSYYLLRIHLNPLRATLIASFLLREPLVLMPLKNSV